jgi:uncharacterized delta-60 repeat protein
VNLTARSTQVARIVGVAVALVLARPAAAGADPGDLDPTFNEGRGVVTTNLTEGFDTAGAVAVQPDGKIVVAGGANDDFTLVRYNRDGSLDRSFGQDGHVITALSGALDIALDVAVQPDGKIVAAGVAVDRHQDFAVARYNRDGSPDRSFGQDGHVVTDFAGFADSAGGVALQRDGKIVLGGTASPTELSGPEFGLARYRPDGTLDPSFGEGGKVVLTVQEPQAVGGQDIVVQRDGKVVLAGTSLSGMVAARVLADGRLDPSFGTGGVTEAPFGSLTAAGAIALGRHGQIVLAGQVMIDTRGPWVIGVARLGPDGTLDTTFGGDGTVTTDITGRDGAFAVLVQRDGRIVAAGEARGDIALVRYMAAGELDTTFSSDGIATTGTPETVEAARAAALQPDGRIVAAGTVDGDVAVARYQGR